MTISRKWWSPHRNDSLCFCNGIFILRCGAPLKASTFLHIVLWNLFRLMHPTLFLILIKLYFWSNSFLLYCLYVVFLWGSPFGLSLLRMFRYVDFHACSHHIKIIKNFTLGACENKCFIGLIFKLILFIIFLNALPLESETRQDVCSHQNWSAFL